MDDAVYLVNGARTPLGSFLGVLASKTAPELGATAIAAALERAGVAPDLVDDVYMGNVVTAGVGQAPARQAMIGAGIPTSAPATTVGKVCGSAMKAIMMGRAQLLLNDATMVVAGGMESMSQTPHLLRGARQGIKMGHTPLEDSMILDGLWDPYNDVHMGNCAERCVEKYQFTRQQLDEYAVRSYERARQAMSDGVFKDEIVPVTLPSKKGDPVVVVDDEGPYRVDLSRITSLKPAFEPTGVITAGNSSTINDGAAAVVLTTGSQVKALGLSPMARIVSVATHSHDPVWFTTAPIYAIQKALDRAGLSAGDIDLYEINEAFAAVALAAITDLKLDPEKVNIRGSGISLGHPIGATGCRIVVTLMYALKQLGKRYGVASLCIGGGEAAAVVIENLSV